MAAKYITIYRGVPPLNGDSEAVTRWIQRETGVTVLFKESSAKDQDTNNEAMDVLLAEFGMHSVFSRQEGTHIRPFYVDRESGKITHETPRLEDNMTADSLRDTRFYAAGMFFDEQIEEAVLGTLKDLGYR